MSARDQVRAAILAAIAGHRHTEHGCLCRRPGDATQHALEAVMSTVDNLVAAADREFAEGLAVLAHWLMDADLVESLEVINVLALGNPAASGRALRQLPVRN